MFPHICELSFISPAPPPLSTNLEYNLQSSTEPGYTVKGFDKVDVNIGNGGRNTSWQFYNYKLNVNVWDGELERQFGNTLWKWDGPNTNTNTH